MGQDGMGWDRMELGWDRVRWHWLVCSCIIVVLYDRLNYQLTNWLDTG